MYSMLLPTSWVVGNNEVNLQSNCSDECGCSWEIKKCWNTHCNEHTDGVSECPAGDASYNMSSTHYETTVENSYNSYRYCGLAVEIPKKQPSLMWK